MATVVRCELSSVRMAWTVAPGMPVPIMMAYLSMIKSMMGGSDYWTIAVFGIEKFSIGVPSIVMLPSLSVTIVNIWEMG